MGRLPIKTLIADDEVPAREELRYLLESGRMAEVCGEADCGEDAYRLVLDLKPELVFLDICLGDTDGITVARELVAAGSSALIVFATAYNQYAVEAFEVHAVDYILKPFLKERVEKTLSRAQKVLEEKNAAGSLSQAVCLMVEERLGKLGPARKKFNKIPAYSNHSLCLIEPGEIMYACVEEGYVYIVTGRGRFRYNWAMQDLEKKLGEELFCRTHRAFLVNMHKITRVVPWFKGTCKLVMESGCEVPVSRFYMKNIKELLDLR